jgi:hypothetical protein
MEFTRSETTPPSTQPHPIPIDPVDPDPVLLPRTLPLALAAAFFPAGVVATIWLLSTTPALHRGLAFLGGAAVTTVGSGVVILALVRMTGGTAAHRPVASVFEIGAGAVLVAIALWLAVRGPATRGSVLGDLVWPPRGPSSLAVAVLGMAMWAPSLAYVAALQEIADSDLGLIAVTVNLLVVAVVVLSPIEVPLLICALAPRRAERSLPAVRDWVSRRMSWPLVSAAAAVGGAYLVLRGSCRLG